MDTIEAARSLGRAIQADGRWVNLRLCEQQNEQDEALQTMISVFEQRRALLNGEMQKEDRDIERIKELNDEVRDIYARVMGNENMVAFSQARTEVNELLEFITQIISGSAEGRDPDLIEYSQGCGGDCGGCSGCH
ncbi:MAG: YlbF family regulator [Oscillospiraceae bacterium]|jgi:cell fate (sporulation/competence/biofilm development) regulator YlbF (YheA/YmcA/DUF963 family)|nr:YlbF family regulator [Oscillospiraceae bacterium]